MVVRTDRQTDCFRNKEFEKKLAKFIGIKDSSSMIYFLKEQRIQGETFRLQKVFGGPWQVFVLNQQTGQVEPLPPFEERPSYRELEALLQSREGSIAAMNWVERAQSEMTFNAESLTRKPNNTNQDE